MKQIELREMEYLFSLPCTVRNVSPGDGQSAAYHAGRKPPNYPVPAIPLSVDIGESYVSIDPTNYHGPNQMVVMFQRGGHFDWNYVE